MEKAKQTSEVMLF